MVISRIFCWDILLCVPFGMTLGFLPPNGCDNLYLMCFFWMWYYFILLQYGIILLGINSHRLCVCSEDVIISSSRIEFVCIVLFGSPYETEIFNFVPDNMIIMFFTPPSLLICIILKRTIYCHPLLWNVGFLFWDHFLLENLFWFAIAKLLKNK